MDISDSVTGALQRNRDSSANSGLEAHFIQSDLCLPPFPAGTFDLIYSSGVIHHTSDPKLTFEILSTLVKPGGRMYIWLYKKRAMLLELIVALSRAVSVRLPLSVLKWICILAAPLFKIYRVLLNSLKIREFPDKNLREISLSLFDTFSPRYVFKYSPEEIAGWFKDNGFKNINLSSDMVQGFGIYADK
jgi:SAM-dependent methyltransferase